jgi:hypothetical protein
MAIGVEVTTSTQTGPSNAGPESSRFQIAGLTERGPVDASVLLESLADFESVYGSRTAYASNAYDTARTFWEEGGTELIVSRAVGPAAQKGSLTLKDGAGTPLDTIRIEAASAGAYSAGLKVEIKAGVIADSFTFVLTLNGVIVTQLRNLTSPEALVTGLSTNPYVRASTLGSITAAPQNNPKVVAATSLTAGSDDRANVTTAEVIAALDLPVRTLANQSIDIEGCAVAAPGYPADVIGDALIEYAKAKNKIALLAGDASETKESIAVLAQTLVSGAGDAAGLFFPHIVIPDGSGTRTLSPEGYVAAVRARAHTEVGFWQAAPGDRSITQWVLGTAVGVDKAANNDLADAQVNGLVTIGGQVRLYGWSSLSNDRENLGLLSARDSLNNLTAELRKALEPFVFATVDGKGHLLSAVQAATTAVLSPISNDGGFFARVDYKGEQTDPGYRVVVNRVNNPASALQENEVHVSVAVRLSPVAALISAEIIKVALTDAVSV